jgi:hypothetical protein
MTPKRLLPFLAIFLVLACIYFFLEWQRDRAAHNEQEAKRLFAVKEPDITAITIKRSGEEIRLVREGQDWRLDQPLKDRADGLAMNSLLAALSQLRLHRDLGPQTDLKPFGLDQPAFVISFMVGDKSHTINVGKKAPGGQGYYVGRDQDPKVVLIDAAAKDTLDRPLSALRNRILFDFSPEQVKALRVKIGANQVALEKKDNSWTIVGREPFKIYPDRLERLLRFISLARVKEFAPEPLKDLKTYGLAPPALELTVVTDKGEQTLSVGARKQEECYARQGDQGPVVLMESLLLDLFTSPLESVAGLKHNPLWEHVRGAFPNYLEDRRLWTGEVKDVAGLTWGPPEKTWTAAKTEDFYKFTGPDKQELRQPAVRVELALLKLRELEVERPLSSPTSEDKAKNSVELRNAGGQTLFRLEELGLANGQVKVRYLTGGGSPREALVSKPAFDQWQKEMSQLAAAPPSTGNK